MAPQGGRRDPLANGREKGPRRNSAMAERDNEAYLSQPRVGVEDVSDEARWLPRTAQWQPPSWRATEKEGEGEKRPHSLCGNFVSFR